MKYPSWHALPSEIQLIIFDLVESVKELATCRLVCKQWNPLAEETMFGQKLELSTINTTIKFIYHIKKKPMLARFIKSLYLPYIDDSTVLLQKKLIDLASTPNIRYLDGQKMSAELFDHFLDIVQRSPDKFDRLQALPNFFRTDPKFVDTMLYFKGSIRELQLETTPLTKPIIPHLNEFKSLKKLVLNLFGMHFLADKPNYFIELEEILCKCNQLQILELKRCFAVEHSMEKAKFREWLLKNVKQTSSLHTFKLDNVADSCMLEYLVYKYPNASKAEVGSFTYKTEGSIECTLDRVKHVESIQLSMYSKEGIEKFKNLLPKLKSKTNRIQISQRSRKLYCAIQMDVTKNNRTDNTTFSIRIPQNAPHTVYKEITSLLGSVDHFEINYLDRRSTKGEDKPLSFFSFLETFPELESLQFSDISINCPPISLGRLKLNRLTSLEINGACVDKCIFQALSLSASNLKHLTLVNCYFSGQNYFISLPNTKLETLSVIKKTSAMNYQFKSGAIEKYLQALHKLGSITEKQRMLLEIKRLSNAESQLYLLTPGATPGTSSCSEQVLEENLTTYIPKIMIECNSLRSLNIDLGALVTKMNF
ncbi:hypothetical protein [Parasitella parasitica]|uniref:F-box domain-containing protein n=1 Tax=Parasitella parasitica TaxID=35722 RepID=A0A0B7MR81_9FUNG|nr:hypothetical protein [Parasitella parasitica]